MEYGVNKPADAPPAPTDGAKLLGRADVLGADDRTYAYVMVPEWGGRLKLRTMTAAERDDFELGNIEETRTRGKVTREVTLRNLRAKLVARCACDEAGKLIFSEQDVAALGKKSGKAMDRVYEIARKLNGMTEDEIEEMVKNSEATPNDNSLSS